MREFIINNHLSLRLEDNQTIIYVKEKRFQHCKFLILTISIDEIASLEEIKSVDEAVEILDRSLENTSLGINNKQGRNLIEPEVEFWAHCSNLQAWYENGYDTQLLHMNLAFSLLHELVIAGDQVAKRVFKEEIAKRLASGYPSVVNYLFNQGYVDFLSREELFHSVLEPEEAETLFDIERVTKFKYHRVEDVESLRVASQQQEDLGHYLIQNKKLVGLDLRFFCGDDRSPKLIVKLKNLKILYLYILDDIEKFPEEITRLKSLEQLSIYIGELSRVKEIPESLGNLSELKRLIIFDDVSLNTLPSSLGNLKKLEILLIQAPNLSILPETIGSLKSLQLLEILDCSLASLSFSVSNLKSLRKLVIANNLLNKSVTKNITLLKFNEFTDYGTFSIFRK